MTQPGTDERGWWPTAKWELTAPESYVLLHGAARLNGEPFKLAVLELVGRRALKLVEVEQSAAFGRHKRVSVLAEGADPKRQSETPLAAVQELFQQTPLHGFADGTFGVAVSDFARTARRRYNPITKYAQAEIVPRLIDRGYYTYQQRKILGFIPTGRYVLTPAGMEARDDLQRRLDLGQANLPGWVNTDDDHAMSYLALAGSSVFLTPMLFGDMAELGRRRRDSGYYGTLIGDGGDDDTRDASQIPVVDAAAVGGLDVSGLDLGSLDLGSLADLDSAMDSMDAGFDSGFGGDGGGDGGGGDGGGGGGD